MAIYPRSSVQNLNNRWFWIRKNNALLHLIKEQVDIDKIYLYAADLSEPKYDFLIKKREYAGTKNFSDPNLFIDFSNTMDTFIRILTTTTQTDKEKFILCLMI